MSAAQDWSWLDALFEHVLVVGADGVVQHLSAAARADLGCTSTAPGLPLAELVGEVSADELLTTLLVAREGQPRTMAVEGGSGRLELRWVPCAAAAGACMVGVAGGGAAPPAAQRRHLDRLVSLGQLVASVAHEITNPNAVIRGDLAIIREAMHTLLPIVDRQAARDPDLEVARLPYSVFRERVAVLLDDMRHSSERIDSLVKSLRHFAAREEDGSSEVVDLDAVVAQAARLVAHRAARSVDLSLQRASRPPCVRGNASQLEQLVVNLLLNAIDAVEAKDKTSSMPGSLGVGVDVRTRWQGQQVVLEIEDQGVGISDALRERIFEPFFTTRGGRGGLGLGLSIVREIVEAHGATLEVASRPGCGSCFRLIFAAAQPD